MASTSAERLNVIALISGGKDSFYTILHCLRHGHRVVALANLYPPPPDKPMRGQEEEDLNSFMYQTAGHQLIPLYQAATGIPLYRGLIVGRAVQSGITYDAPRCPSPSSASAAASGQEQTKERDWPSGPPAKSVGTAHATPALSERQDAESPDSVGVGTPAAFVVSNDPEILEGDISSPVAGPQSQHQQSGPQDGDSKRGQMVMGAAGQQRLGTRSHPAIGSSLSDAGAINSARHAAAACSRTTRPEIASSMEHVGSPLREGAGSVTGRAAIAPQNLDHLGGTSTTGGTSCVAVHPSRSTCAQNRRGDQICDCPSKDCTILEDLSETDRDETESMTSLLETILAAHPEANALCAGAILSTYQRVRVESVASRLGLTPLAFLWKFPILPPPDGQLCPDPAQLLTDMRAAGLSARVVKVASAGLDDDFLWEEVTSPRGIARLNKAVTRFGAHGDGAIIGEGGEFETLVVDGPPQLFKCRIQVDDQSMVVVREGGGCSWLGFGEGKVMPKLDHELPSDGDLCVRVPHALDSKFQAVHTTALEGGENCAVPKGSLPDPPDMHQLPDGGSKLGPVDGVETWVGVCTGYAQSVQDGTRQVMKQFRDRLSAAGLPSTAVISSLVVLRKMSDFAAFNSSYGSSFPNPLPPARVCIGCGDSVPQALNVLVYLTVLAGSRALSILSAAGRQGLHVQSRSYWAPANIGPYSQAIEAPLVPGLSTSFTNADPISSQPIGVAIAGQIPLIPATMLLPDPTEDSVKDMAGGLVLSLQHLWRIAVDVGVQWFVGAVAYIPKSSNGEAGKEEVQQAARLTNMIWNEAHLSGVCGDLNDSGTEDDESGGPDLWDRKFNPDFQMLGTEPKGKREDVPDWNIFVSTRGNIDTKTSTATTRQALVPSVFVAEVDSLPRSAPVEWHVPLSLRALPEGSVQKSFSRTDRTSTGWAWTAEHLVIDLGVENKRFVHSTVSVTSEVKGGQVVISHLLDELRKCWLESLRGDFDGCLTETTDAVGLDVFPYLVYVDEARLRALEDLDVEENILDTPVVPCSSSDRWESSSRKALPGPLLPAVQLWTVQGLEAEASGGGATNGAEGVGNRFPLPFVFYCTKVLSPWQDMAWVSGCHDGKATMEDHE
ncbi:meiotically up-regulated 71 [Zalerion maritima]|uniref:Diphthine--ammonia ligase n=1 Tax=Zalerion maritima TaxID=339359 RepID=A0AAD5RKA8_9PEZI|nr:meiotically up-regulated 71 [Zalerion maritima]